MKIDNILKQLCTADLKNAWNYIYTPSIRGEEHLYFIISSNPAELTVI